MKNFVVLFAMLALFALTAFADVRLPDAPKPKKEKGIDTQMTIRLSPDASEARLIIPKSQLKQLRAELEELDNGDSNTALSLNFTRTQTIASGTFLSLAFIFGGVWFARGRKTELKANKTLAIGAVLFLCGSLATIAYANVGPPIENRFITSKMFSQLMNRDKFGSGKIKIEVSDSAVGVELIVPDRGTTASE
jgi:hypothetical protein